MSRSRSVSPRRDLTSLSSMPSSQPRSIPESAQASGTLTPSHTPITELFHVTLTLPSGDVVDGDFTYNRSHPSTRPNSPNPISLLASRHYLPAPVDTDTTQVLAAAVATTLSAVEPDSEHRPSSAVYAASLDDAERGQAPSGDRSDIDTDSAMAPLLAPAAPAPSQADTTSGCIANFVSPIGSGAYYVVTHPVSTGLAVVTAAPTALNALAAPSGKGPDELGTKWWNNMSSLTQAHSIANGSSSLLINTIMNALFLPTAWHKFRTSITQLFDSIEEFLDNSLSIILAIGGAFASAVIAYNAFLWLPAGVFFALIPAALAFVITMAQRYVGVKNVFRRIRNLFNEDARTQQELADIAQHIHPAHLEEIEARFRQKLTLLLGDKNGSSPLTDSEREQLLVGLSAILSDMEKTHPDLIKDTTTLEYITRYTGILFDMVFAIFIIAPPSLITHMQKGFDGVNTISNLAAKHPLPDMSTILKCLIGLDPGLASALLYANSAMDMRTTLVDLTKNLYQHPRSIPFALTLLLANVFASGGMQNVAMGVVANPDNLPHLKKDTAIADVFIVGMTLGGGVVNTNASVKKAFLSTQQAARDITVKDMADYAARTNEYVICRATGKALRSHSLFTERRAAEAAEQDREWHKQAEPSFL